MQATSPTFIDLFWGLDWTVNKAHLIIWAFASASYSYLKAALFIKKTSIYITQVIFDIFFNNFYINDNNSKLRACISLIHQS